MKKLFKSISEHVVNAQNNDESDLQDFHDVMRFKLANPQKTISADSSHNELTPHTKMLNNKIKLELTTKVNHLKIQVQDKEKLREERNLIAKRAVMNMMLKKHNHPQSPVMVK